jgi:cell division protein FtsZ
MFELLDTCGQSAVIKVIGVGGGGGNAVQHMVDGNIEGVDFICANTDAQALKNMAARTTLQIGSTIAQVAKELGILTVAVVTKPFPFEGNKRMHVANNGIKELGQYVDSLITIPNEKLLSVLGKQISLLDAFKSANDVLLGAVQGIAELITRPGLINVDFADVRTVMSEMGMAMMGSGCAKGEDRAREAAEAAIASPLLEDVNLMGAHGILVNVTAGMDMGIGEFEEVGNTVKEFASENATVVVGTVIDPDMRDELRVTVVATGLGAEMKQPQEKPSLVARKDIGGIKDTGGVDYDRPTIIRKNRPQTRKVAAAGNQAEDLDYLDIPAFLRRQAD